MNVYTPPNGMPPVKIYPVLRGQTALVTGASRGLGRAVAIGFAQAGADVLINHYSDLAGAKETATEVVRLGQRAFIFGADVSQENEVEAMFQAATNQMGRVDICVANAGIQMNADVSKLSLQEWQRVIDVNLTGAFLCARSAIRIFEQQGIQKEISYSGGKLIFMSSVHDVIPWGGHSNYAAAKGGLKLLMESLAQEIAHLRIRVNNISPGAIRTPMNVEKITSPEMFESTLLRLIPCGRIGEPEDVARAATWLASDDSDYVHGTTLYVDGGMTLYPGFYGAG